jgi:hypothetical protein
MTQLAVCNPSTSFDLTKINVNGVVLNGVLQSNFNDKTFVNVFTKSDATMTNYVQVNNNSAFTYFRFNFDFGSGKQSNKMRYKMTKIHGSYFSAWSIYGSNDVADYTSIASTVSGNAFLITSFGTNMPGIIVEVLYALSNSFRYISVIGNTVVYNGSTNINFWLHLFEIAVESGESALTPAFDPASITISTDSTNGYPMVTRAIGSSPAIVSYSNLNVFENYRRVWPTIRDASMKIENGLITSTSTLYESKFIPVSSMFVGTYANNIMGCYQMAADYDSISCTFQLPKNYKAGTPIKLRMPFMSNNYSTTGDVSFFLSWNIFPAELIGESTFGVSNTETVTYTSVFGTPYYNYWAVFTDLTYASYLNPLSIITFMIQRPNAGSSSLDTELILVKGVYFIYQINSFATTS